MCPCDTEHRIRPPQGCGVQRDTAQAAPLNSDMLAARLQSLKGARD